MNNTKYIAIDGNILTYYTEANCPGYNPDTDTDKIKPERIASLQIPLYSKWYAILPAVRDEYKQIRETWKLEQHVLAEQVFIDYKQSMFDENIIKERAEYFNKFHAGKNNYNDCKIAAEAEYLQDTTILLSTDKKFINKISTITVGLLIIKPTDFVKKFNLKNSAITISPAESNPLFHETWWRF